jgi:hypothetical protein
MLNPPVPVPFLADVVAPTREQGRPPLAGESASSNLWKIA